MSDTDRREVLKSTGFHRLRMQAFFSMSILYLFYYFCRYNLGTAAKGIQDEFGYSNQAFGMVTTVFTLVYAAGQFANGFLGDRYGPKRIMLIGAVGGAVANVCFGLSGGLWLFIIFWAVNAYFASCGWAPGSRILFNWFPENRWGTWMGIYNALCYLGGGIVAIVAGYAVHYWGWRAAFFVAPAFLLAMAVVFLLLGKSSPRDAGLDIEWEPTVSRQPHKRANGSDYWIAFTNFEMNLSYIAGFGANFVRWGIIAWMIKILAEPAAEGGFGLSLFAAATITSMAHWGGAIFSVTLGIVSDRLFKGKRWQTIIIGLVLCALPLFYIAQGPIILEYGSSITLPWGLTAGLVLLGAAMFISGGMIQAVQTPLFDLPGAILGVDRGGTGVGIMDGWMYVGASFAGVFLGWWMDTYGLMSGVSLMATVSLVSGLAAALIRR